MNQRHPFKYLKGFLKYWELYAPWELEIFVYNFVGNILMAFLLGNWKHVSQFLDERTISPETKSYRDNMLHQQDESKQTEENSEEIPDGFNPNQILQKHSWKAKGALPLILRKNES